MNTKNIPSGFRQSGATTPGRSRELVRLASACMTISRLGLPADAGTGKDYWNRNALLGEGYNEGSAIRIVICKGERMGAASRA